MAHAMGNPVLRALDNAKTQSYHFKAVAIAGMGFFTDAYDLFVIGILTKLLGRIYYFTPLPGDKLPTAPGILPVNVLAAVNGTALCGTLAGQLTFGWLGDKFGRKRAYGMTLILMFVASLGQGLSLSNTATSVISTLLFFRFWLGFGIGGEYPLSATIMSEYSNTSTRGMFVAAVFAMQGVGYLVAATVTIIITAIFKQQYPRHSFSVANPPNVPFHEDYSTPHEADFVWRIVLMLGAIPAAATYYYRSKMPETARYTALIQNNQQQAALDMEKILHKQFDSTEVTNAAQMQRKTVEYTLFSREFARRHGLEIFGTCLTWFLLDVTFYSQNLAQGNIFSAVGWVPKAPSMSGLEETFKTARAQAIIAMIGTIPGYWFTVGFVDWVGRKPIQLMGFFFMSVFLIVLAFNFYSFDDSSNKTGHVAFVIVYGLIFFFCNFGPNSTTFIVPAELFPARLRSTCHGISAASGKAGAILGTFGFTYASVDKITLKNVLPPGYPGFGIGYKWSFCMLAMSAVAGFFATLLCIPETKGESLEDLSGESSDAKAVNDGEVTKEVDHDSGSDT